MSAENYVQEIHQGTADNMDDLKKSQESMGAAAAGVKRQISETAADAKEKLTEIGGNAADQLSEVAQSATDKAKAAADYLRQTEVSDMAEDLKDIVKALPGLVNSSRCGCGICGRSFA
ncbi:MAG TPA: hypothetical protein VGO27_04930 [Candidatus Acidoferrum sp.]|jgi:F0F1-type ATP synthase membrane subunit b/b'|nr:hypothetical protein [Candidatus Acidoferrum sp.]